jgi:hypothetical protein
MMGFELLERAARDSDADAALAYATQLGAYLDEPFSPDPADPVPVGQRGMKPHEVAVASARRWWAAHGRRIEAEVAKVKPRPA